MNEELIGLTADIVSAYVSHNSVPISDLPKLIADVYSAVKALGASSAEPVVKLEPARADQQIGDTGVPYLPGGREEVQIPKAVLHDALWADAG